MGFQTILHNVSEGPIIVLLIITIPLCIAATILRFVATRRSGRRIGWEDLCAALALVAFLVYGFLALAGFAITGGVSSDKFTLDQAITTSKMAYAAAPFFEINQLFAKASLLILYYRIFSRDKTFVRWAFILAGIQIVWFIAICFSLIFMCVPVSKWWDVLDMEEGWCLKDAALLAAEETVNSCVDFAIMALAVSMVRKLQLKIHIKRKLAFVFIVGGLSGVLGFVKIGEVYAVPDEDGKTNVTNSFWDLLQMAVTLLCCCAPIYKSALPPEGFCLRLKSSITSLGSSTRIKISNNGGKEKPSHSSKSSGLPNSQTSTTEVWPRFHGGDRTQYSWCEAETQTIDEISPRYQDSQVMKTVQIRHDIQLV